MPSRRDRIERAAREVLGFERLRPGQAEAAESVLAGRDTLAVLSTGSGKSAIYQLAGFLIDGPTVVVSPLIALQQDQMEDVEEEAAVLNSTLTERQREAVIEDVADDEVEFVLLAPESRPTRRARRGSSARASNPA
jgi:ATP-dependent DNA helicase RecQ